MSAVDGRPLAITIQAGKFEEMEYAGLQPVKVKELETLNRRCLRCNAKFEARGRFNRVCYACTVNEAYCGASRILDYCT